jgi:hypothetical protein
MAAPEVVQKESEFEKLRLLIQEIIAFTNTLDEKYREKCFEVLLNFYLHKWSFMAPATAEAARIPKEKSAGEATPLPLPVRAFLSQNNIPVDSIEKLFLIENGEVVPKYKIKEQKKATAQIQLAMLSAFKNALVSPGTMFEFSIKDVRELCKEHDVYDIANFTANFKKNNSLFKDLASDEEHVKLTPDGKTELAEAIVAVSNQ